MTATASFGFETEFEEAAEELTASLHSASTVQNHLIGTATLHQYHCECMEACNLNRENYERGWHTFALRAQRDSSCSGELISKVFTDMDEARPVLAAIEEHSLLVDATPGFDAGFHVHVGIGHLSALQMFDAFFEYLRFEPLLTFLAAGRWEMLREMNQSVRDMLYYHIAEQAGDNGDYAAQRVDRNLATIRTFDAARLLPRVKQRLYEVHHDNDRHSHLSVRTRFVTWEFRVFNSSRSAWRMALWIGLARAFVDHEFIALLQQIDTVTFDRRGTVAFIEALRDSGNADVAVLCEKQHNYLLDRSGTAPDEFTALVMDGNRILA